MVGSVNSTAMMAPPATTTATKITTSDANVIYFPSAAARGRVINEQGKPTKKEYPEREIALSLPSFLSSAHFHRMSIFSAELRSPPPRLAQ